MAERVLSAILRLAFDKGTARDVKAGVVSMDDAIEELAEQAYEAQEALMLMTVGTEVLARSAQSLSDIGRSISAPLTDAARQFVDYAGRADAVSRQWLDSTVDVQKAYTRVGRVAAKAILPTMEAMADLAGRAAGFVEEYPSLVKAAVNLAAITTTLGVVGIAVTKGIRFYPDVKMAIMEGKRLIAAIAMKIAAKQQLAAAVGMQTAATEVLVGMAPILGAAAAIAGGVGIGLAVIDKLSETEAGIRMGIQGLAETATVVAFLVGKLMGGEEKGMEWAARIGATTGAIDKLAAESYLAAQDIEMLGAVPREIVEAYIEYQRELELGAVQHAMELERIQRQYNEEDRMMAEQHDREMLLMQRDFDRQEGEALRQHERQRSTAVRDFAREEARTIVDHRREMAASARDFALEENRAQEEYYVDRQRAAEAFGVEMARMEADHQRQMRHMQEDHESRMTEAIGSRDALAMVREVRSYEKERRRAEEEYGIEAARRNEDYAREMAEQEAQFARQREQRLADYERQIAEQEEQLRIEQELRKAEFVQQQADDEAEFQYEREEEKRRFGLEMADREEEYGVERNMEGARRQFEQSEEERMFQEERALMEARLADRLRQIDEDTGIMGDRERERRNQYYDLMVRDAEVFMQHMRNSMFLGETYYAGSRQAGGYVGRGLYNLGEAGREFVLSAPTTRAAEGLTGGSLSQDAVLASLIAGGGVRRSSSAVTVNQNFQFHGSFSEADRQWFRHAAREEAIAAVDEVIH